MGEVPGQGKYLIPLESFLENKLSEQRHENSMLKCSYAGGYINNTPNKQNIARVPQKNHENVHLSHDSNNVHRNNEKPFVITTCKLPAGYEPKPLKKPEVDSTSTISSLSSFEYNGHHYASTKVNVFFFFLLKQLS